MMGDEIMVVSTEGIHDFGIPELFKPYVVVGIKHRQRENWQGPETDTTYYQIEPMGMTDEERTGAMLAGGGRAKPLYIFPKDSSQQHSGNYMKEADQWILRPGFLRGELEEQPNEIARTLSKARKDGVGTRFPKSAVKANPQRFRKYTRDKYLKEHNQPGLNPELKVGDTIRVIDVDGEHKNMPERFKIYKVFNVSVYDKNNFIYDLISPDLDLEKVSVFDYKNLYRGDTWIKMDNTIKEQEQPGLSPVLTYGDTILVVDVDREKESGNTSYTTPREGMRPAKYTPYTVVDKESNGSQSKWSWRYTLVPEDKLDEYEERLSDEYGDYETYEKLLYPWIYEWIYADTKTASKVDKLTITEQGVDTSWANDDDKVTLQDILELTKDIPTISYPTKELAKLPSLKKIVLGWDPEEIERISQVDVSRQYPILVMVNEYNEVQWILDGNHRAQQAVMNDIPTIPAKLIKPSDLDERSIKMFYPEGIPGGELGEEGETNEASRTLSKARKAGVDTYYPKSAVKSNPQRFRKYTRDKYLKEDLKNWSYDGDNIGVEEELDEYCPMGNPNKCKLVDYNNLPDMITDEVVEEQFDNEITVADAIKKDIMKVLSMRFVLQPTEESNIKDSEGQSYNIIDTENPLEVVEIEMLIQPIIDMVNSGVAGGELTPQDTNLAISGVTDWLSLAMNQKVELPN